MNVSSPSLNNLSEVSNMSSGIHFFEDIFFWERLKFDWVSNLNSFNDFAFTFLDDDADVILMAHSDINILKHLLSHWRDLAYRHSNIEKLTSIEYKFLYYDSLKLASNLWEFLQFEFIKMGTDVNSNLSRVVKSPLKRSHSYPIEQMENINYYPTSLQRSYSSTIYDVQYNGPMRTSLHSPLTNSRSATPTIELDTLTPQQQSPRQCHTHNHNVKPDDLTLEFIDFFNSLNQNLALFLLIEGPKTIPPKFRNVYKNLIQILCKTHGSFLPTIMQMKKNDRLRPIEFEGCWDSDATCCVCYETHGAFVKRCCDTSVCENCFTIYINDQVNSHSRIHMECPAANCSKPIRFQSIWIRLTEKNRKIYEKIKNNQLQTDVRKLCPHCMQFYELSNEEKEQLSKKKYRKLYKKGFNVKCHLCQWQWCFKCQTPVHSLTCKKNLSTDKLLMKWANSPAEAIQNNVKKARKCPKCHVLVERNGGCPHMECSKCKCSWCYDCGRRRIKIKHIPFMNHDSRFFILGCSKNLLANQPHLRRFVRICVFCGITVLIVPASAVAVVVLIVLGVLLGLPFGIYMLGVKLSQCSCSR